MYNTPSTSLYDIDESINPVNDNNKVNIKQKIDEYSIYFNNFSLFSL
ncbi:MAG: hypothetical protein RR290_04335 [Clostridia bacterium]